MLKQWSRARERCCMLISPPSACLPRSLLPAASLLRAPPSARGAPSFSAARAAAAATRCLLPRFPARPPRRWQVERSHCHRAPRGPAPRAPPAGTARRPGPRRPPVPVRLGPGGTQGPGSRCQVLEQRTRTGVVARTRFLSVDCTRGGANRHLSEFRKRQGRARGWSRGQNNKEGPWTDGRPRVGPQSGCSRQQSRPCSLIPRRPQNLYPLPPSPAQVRAKLPHDLVTSRRKTNRPVLPRLSLLTKTRLRSF